MNPFFTQKLDQDWSHSPLLPPVEFSLAQDNEHLIFEAHRTASYRAHPLSSEGKFQAELWRYDVAELFLLEPESGRYLEINLAPNGGWWMSWFEAPRRPLTTQPTFHDISATAPSLAEGWKTSLRIPLQLLPPLPSLRYNVTFILNSPKQVFLSLAPLPGDEPDYHQPQYFLPWPSVPS